MKKGKVMMARMGGNVWEAEMARQEWLDGKGCRVCVGRMAGKVWTVKIGVGVGCGGGRE